MHYNYYYYFPENFTTLFPFFFTQVTFFIRHSITCMFVRMCNKKTAFCIQVRIQFFS